MATVRVLDLVRRAARTGKRGKIVLQTSAVWETMGGVPELLRQLNKVVDSVAVAPGEWLAWSTTLLLTFKQVLQTLRKEDSDRACAHSPIAHSYRVDQVLTHPVVLFLQCRAQKGTMCDSSTVPELSEGMFSIRPVPVASAALKCGRVRCCTLIGLLCRGS